MENIVHACRNISSGNYGTFFIFSVKVTLVMQVIGFSVRLSSSLLWIQIYRLGVSYVDTTVPRETDFDLRNSFLSPATPAVVRQTSGSDDVLGGSIYDPAYYSSLFEDGQDNRCLLGVRHLSLTYAYHAYLRFLDKIHLFFLLCLICWNFVSHFVFMLMLSSVMGTNFDPQAKKKKMSWVPTYCGYISFFKREKGTLQKFSLPCCLWAS